MAPSKSRAPRWHIRWKGAGDRPAPLPAIPITYEQRLAELDALVERAKRGESPISAAQATRELFP